MDSPTVDYGIDLGTTNSVLAKANGKTVEIVPNTLEGELTPSAVASASGQLLIGQDALDTLASSVTKFKRQMGTSNTYTLDDGRIMTPVELSAEVLKELKESVQLRYDTSLTAAVITVPAMFLQPQCEATRQAAEAAGIHVAMLLQEPIAAATAYLSDSKTDGHYLVYDLGGGTFDVSVVRLRNGEMTVVAHGGDNYLGGTDFDRAVADRLIEKLNRQSIDTSILTETFHYTRLLRLCEQARVRLSVKETQLIDLSDFDLSIAKVDITREEVERVIASYVDDTIRLSKERLSQASLITADIQNLILVGGPTRMPYIRRRLDEELGIPRSHEMNPMTIVARGAAIHASSLRVPARQATRNSNQPQEANVDLELHFDPVSNDLETSIAGKVKSPAGFAGEIRLTSSAGDWDSGWIGLKNGAFVTSVQLISGGTREFKLSVRDITGHIWQVVPTSMVIRHGIAAAQPIAPYNYGVALQGNEFAPIIRAGQPLPAYGRETFKAARTITAGSQDMLQVFFTEGLSPIANDNVKVGEINIFGRQITRTLRENDEIEVRMRLDESRLLKANIYIPMIDEEFPITIVCEENKPKQRDLQTSLGEVSTIIQQLTTIAQDDDQDVLDHVITDRERIEADLERFDHAEIGESERVAKKLADIKARVNTVKDKYKAQLAYINANERIDAAESVAREFSDRPSLALITELRSDADHCLERDDAHGLESIRQSADQVFWKLYVETERCWVGLVDYLRDSRPRAIRPNEFHDHLQRAEQCLSHKDYDGVRTFGTAALELLPGEEAQSNRFYNAGLRR